MEHGTRLQRNLETLVGRDQARGLSHLSSVLDVQAALRERRSPFSIVAPDVSSLSKESVEGLSDTDKIVLCTVLDNLGAHASTHRDCTGLNWDHLVSLFATSVYLISVPEKMEVLKDVRSRPKMLWVRRSTRLEVEPDPEAIYGLLSEIARQQDSDSGGPDLAPLRDLMTPGLASTPHSRRSGFRLPCVFKIFSSHTRPRAVREANARGDIHDATHPTPSAAPSSGGAPKGSEKAKTSTADPVLDIITMKFPTASDPKLTAKRLRVSAWTSVDRRLFFPRAQTVIRIATFERGFGARKEALDPLKDTEMGKRAIAKVGALFDAA